MINATTQHQPEAISILVDDVQRHFHLNGQLVKAVDGVSFAIPQGVFAAITGPSGSGKSTLLSLLGGLESPTAGTIHVDGVDVGHLRGRAADRFRRSKVGFVFQDFNLIPNLSALENVMLPMELAGTPKPSRERRALELLSLVDVANRQDHRPSKLSGGQQQRVAIARALANDAAVLLVDEPTGNLDSKTGRRIVGLLHDLTKQGRTVVVVTHDRAITERAGLRLELRDGRIVDSSLQERKSE
jgi:ABC-type lipoprotein export system ATPase subunit